VQVKAYADLSPERIDEAGVVPFVKQLFLLVHIYMRTVCVLRVRGS
jgi:hypothetical protein